MHKADSPQKVPISGDLADKYAVDIDIGGTNTDAIFSRKHKSIYLKVDTTPHDLRECVKKVIENGAAQLGILETAVFLRKTLVMRLSTSLSTNALVERRGGRIGMLLGKGQRIPYLSQFQHMREAESIIARNMLEEIDPDLSEEDIRKKVYRLLVEGATSLVISLDFSPDFALAEKTVKLTINRYFAAHFIGSIPILRCSQISTDPNFFKRTNTALLNAYTYDSLSLHILGIEDMLRDMGYAYPLLLVHSTGGSARTVKSTAIETLSSGAAAGIYGAANLLKHYGKSHGVIVDVGGTSTEIGLVRHGTITYAESSYIDKFPIDAFSPVYATIGIGGGSIARVDEDGKLHIGPNSAGAFPGPVCYNLGGMQPTLTDAFLVLGYFDERFFLGGRKRIVKHISKKVIENEIAAPLGITCEDAALSIKRKAIEMISKQIQNAIASSERVASKFTLLAVGGGGGCVGADLADYMRIEEVHIFRQGAVFGAFGSSNMNIMHQYKNRIHIPWEKGKNFWKSLSVEFNEIVLDLQRIASKDMAGEGFPAEGIRYEVELQFELSPLGKMLRLPMPSPFLWLDEKQKKIMTTQFEKLFLPFSARSERNSISLNGVFVNAYGIIPRVSPTRRWKISDPKDIAKKRPRAVYTLSDEWIEVPVYQWDSLLTPGKIEGPALIESEETTVFLPRSKTIDFDEVGNGIMKGRLFE